MSGLTRQFQSVMITGGAGFLGSAQVEYLLAEPGFSGQVLVVDALTYAGSMDHVEAVCRSAPSPAGAAARVRFERADVRDEARLVDLLERYRVDLVIHFAAETHVDRSIDGPLAFAHTNVLGTASLVAAICAVRAGGAKVQLHHVSTDEVFGECGPGALSSEASAYAPRSPYAASKAASDHWVRAAGNTFGLPFTITHASNCVGPRQHPEKFVPLFILGAAAALPLPLYGGGGQERDWLAWCDHASAVWAVATRGALGQSYCVSAAQVRTNREVAESICEAVARKMGREPSAVRALIAAVRDRPGHDRRYALDASRLRGELGWAPKLGFEPALEAAVDWYLALAEAQREEGGAAALVHKAKEGARWLG